MNNSFIKYFEKSSIFFDKQFGFRSNHSTVHAIILTLEKIYSVLGSGIYFLLSSRQYKAVMSSKNRILFIVLALFLELDTLLLVIY